MTIFFLLVGILSHMLATQLGFVTQASLCGDLGLPFRKGSQCLKDVPITLTQMSEMILHKQLCRAVLRLVPKPPGDGGQFLWLPCRPVEHAMPWLWAPWQGTPAQLPPLPLEAQALWGEHSHSRLLCIASALHLQ